MPLFDRKPETKEHGTAGLKEEAGQEPAECAQLVRQLEDERRQRLEDVQKERAERLAAQEEQRLLQKENRRLTQEASDLCLRLEEERARAQRRGFFGAILGAKQDEDSSGGR